MAYVAMYYKDFENDSEAAGRIARQLWPMREKLPEARRRLIQTMLPEQQFFEKQFDKAVAAVEKDRWDEAARHLEKAVALELDYLPCDLMPACMKNPPAACYLLGLAYLQLAKWAESRRATKKMIAIAPGYNGKIVSTGRIFPATIDQARSLIVTAYLKEGLADKGLESRPSGLSGHRTPSNRWPPS